jgi:hypothetical protein
MNDPKDIFYGPQDQARLFFRFIGTSVAKVIIPLPKPPNFFPNDSDVIIIGQWETDVSSEGFFAEYVLVEKEGNIAFIQATP